MNSNIGSIKCDVCGKTVAEHGKPPGQTVADQINNRAEQLAESIGRATGSRAATGIIERREPSGALVVEGRAEWSAR